MNIYIYIQRNVTFRGLNHGVLDNVKKTLGTDVRQRDVVAANSHLRRSYAA